jgi:hypothetical protein
MKPPRTASQLLGQLDADLAWRLQEITSVRRAIRRADGVDESALLRAAIPLLYAHWEGYIKGCAGRYAAFISGLGVTFGEVQRSFMGLKALSQVKTLHAISKRLFTSSELLDSLYAIEFEKVTLPVDGYISNVGNLNFDMFEQIAGFLAIDAKPYAVKKPLIDESLLGRRNDIAHGEYLVVDAKSFEDLSDEILSLMRAFKTDVQNAVVLKSFLRATTVAAP